jgi:hypothetical protein
MSALCPVSGVDAITSHGVGRSRSFVARSIAYDPRTLTTEGIFLGSVLAPRGRAWSPFSLVFHTFSVAYFLSREPRKRRQQPVKPEKPGKTGKNRKNRKNRKKREKPEKTGKNRKKAGKTEKSEKTVKKTKKKRKTGKKRKKWKKAGKGGKRREKGSQTIIAYRIENTLKLATSP